MGKSQARPLPQPHKDVVSRRFDDEYVVLDTRDNRAHALDGDVARLWAAVEACTWPDLPERRIDEIVAVLTEQGLLEAASDSVDDEVDFAAGISRRTLIKVGAVTGVALTGITSLALPAAALAASEIPNFKVSGSTSVGTTTTDTFTIAAGTTLYVTIVAGGGGGGSGGGAGGNGYVWRAASRQRRAQGRSNSTWWFLLEAGAEPVRSAGRRVSATRPAAWVAAHTATATAAAAAAVARRSSSAPLPVRLWSLSEVVEEAPRPGPAGWPTTRPTRTAVLARPRTALPPAATAAAAGVAAPDRTPTAMATGGPRRKAAGPETHLRLAQQL